MSGTRLLLIAALYVGLVRPRLRSWGATAEEVAMPLPGDDLFPEARASTMATTLRAGPPDVWPWLVQMGCDKAGFYSWDRLDNGGRSSAERIHAEWQDLGEGDRVVCVPDGCVWFEVIRCEPERTLLLRCSVDLPSGRPFHSREQLPRAFNDGLWGFHLRPTADGATRLIVRTLGVGRPRTLIAAANLLFWEPVHWLMQTKQFAELGRRV